MDVCFSHWCWWLAGIHSWMFTLRFLIHNTFLVSGNNFFHKKSFLRRAIKCSDVSRRPAVLSELLKFLISSSRNWHSIGCFRKFFSRLDFLSTLAKHRPLIFDIPKRDRSLTSKSPAINRRNQYLRALWNITPSPRTEQIDAPFVCFNGVSFPLEFISHGKSNIVFRRWLHSLLFYH